MLYFLTNHYQICCRVACLQNVKCNKSVESFLRQLKTWHCSHLLLHAMLLCTRRPPLGVGRCYWTIFSAHWAHSSKPTAVACSSQQTDRQTDGRTLYCYTDPAAYYVSSVSKNHRPHTSAVAATEFCYILVWVWLISVNPVWHDVSQRTRVHVKTDVKTIRMNLWGVRNSKHRLETDAFLT